MRAIIMDTLGYIDTQTALSIIIIINGDQATLRKLKEDLCPRTILSAEPQDKVTKLEENKSRLLKWNNNFLISAQ